MGRPGVPIQNWRPGSTQRNGQYHPAPGNGQRRQNDDAAEEITFMTVTEIDEVAKRDANKVRDLSEFAKKFLVELNGELTQFEVEEVMFNGDKWVVTVSYFRKISEPN